MAAEMSDVSFRLGIRPGDRVTVVNRFGQERTGVATLFNWSMNCWVLNMGGRHGTPAIADKTNIVRVKHKGGR